MPNCSRAQAPKTMAAVVMRMGHSDPINKKITSITNGLGLAIAHKAIQLHHGNIHIKNREKGGLCVEILIPLQEVVRVGKKR